MSHEWEIHLLLAWHFSLRQIACQFISKSLLLCTPAVCHRNWRYIIIIVYYLETSPYKEIKSLLHEIVGDRSIYKCICQVKEGNKD